MNFEKRSKTTSPVKNNDNVNSQKQPATAFTLRNTSSLSYHKQSAAILPVRTNPQLSETPAVLAITISNNFTSQNKSTTLRNTSSLSYHKQSATILPVRTNPQLSETVGLGLIRNFQKGPTAYFCFFLRKQSVGLDFCLNPVPFLPTQHVSPSNKRAQLHNSPDFEKRLEKLRVQST